MRRFHAGRRWTSFWKKIYRLTPTIWVLMTLAAPPISRDRFRGAIRSKSKDNVRIFVLLVYAGARLLCRLRKSHWAESLPIRADIPQSNVFEHELCRDRRKQNATPKVPR